MKRREFIRLGGFLTVSAAAIGLTGCDPVGDNDNTSTSSLLDPAIYPNPVREMPAAAAGAGWFFPQSVASGDPKADSIVLWTRVLPTTQAALDEATVNTALVLRISSDAANAANVGTATVLATPAPDVTVPAYADFDGTVRHKLIGLNPDTTYYYQFVAGDVASKIGRFRTAPEATSARTVKFAFLSCQDWSDNHWGVFEDMVTKDAADNLDFVVHLGDYIYETDTSVTTGLEAGHGAHAFPNGAFNPNPDGTVPASGPKHAVTKADYRSLYKLYRSDPRLQAVHERFAFVAVWDDHEFSDDCWQNLETYTNGNSPQTERRRSANQAWFEYMPADVVFQEANPNFNNIKLYRDLKFGTTVHLVMTDERLYKQDHLIPENTRIAGDGPDADAIASPGETRELGRINSRYLVPETSMKYAETLKNAGQPDMALITMLGSTQRQWWKDTMAGSSSAWKVWGNEVSLLRMGLNGFKAVGTLVGLQTLQGTGATMTASNSDSSVQAIPKATAGAGAAVGAGATSTVAIPAAFAMLTAYSTAYATWLAANPGDTAGAASAAQTAAITAGAGAGLTMPQAGAALSAIGAKTPSAAEIAICAVTVVAGTQMYMTTGLAKSQASQLAAGATVGAFLTDAGYGGTAPDAALLAVFKGALLDDTAGAVVLACYKGAKATAAGGGTPTQIITAGAGLFASTAAAPIPLPTSFLRIRAEIEAGKAASSYVIEALKTSAALGSFLRKFLINADQWDGYGKERQDLVNHLAARGIQNVVAVTGDIHAFFAGTVHANYAGEVLAADAAGNELATQPTTTAPVMVDLVGAGVSSTSWYNYLSVAAAGLSEALVTLVSYSLPPAATGLPFTVKLPVLDFSLGKPATPANVGAMVTNGLLDSAAAAGISPTNLGTALAAGGKTIGDVVTAIASNPSLRLLCGVLSLMGQETNPWLKHVDTNAQGYSVVTASTANLSCEFRRVNKALVSGALTGGVLTGYRPGKFPSPHPLKDDRTIVSSVAVATVTSGVVDVVIS